MVSTADVESGIVAVVPAVVITSMDVSKTPVELTEEVVSAEVVPRAVLSTEVVPMVVVSAEVGPSAVISTDVDPSVVILQKW